MGDGRDRVGQSHHVGCALGSPAVVATVGERIDPGEFGPMPERIRIERFNPQELLLPVCDLVVSHGGSGSLLGALAHGLPSVLFPMGADQPHNAQRCVDLGTACVLDPVRATPDEINALPDVQQTIPLLEGLR